MSKELTTKQHQDLGNIATHITDKVNSAIKSVVSAKISIGKDLIKARSILKTDEAFGAWREQHTPIASKQEAHYCMQVAKKFSSSGKLIENVPYSVLRELITAPDDLIKDIEETIAKGGAVPTTQDARKLVASTKTKPSQKTEVAATIKPQISKGPDIGTMVASKFMQRKAFAAQMKFRFQNTAGWGYLVLGFDPEPKVRPNPEAITGAGKYLKERYPEDVSTITACVDICELDIAESYS